MSLTKKRMIPLLLAVALLSGLLLLPVTRTKAAETSKGYWTLISGPVTEKGLEEYYGTSHIMSHKVDKTAGTVTHYRKISYSTPADGPVEANFVTTYSLAPSKIDGDSTVTLNISTSVDRALGQIHSNNCNFYYDSMRFYRKYDDSNYGSDLSIETGPNAVLSGSETVYYKIPAGKVAGETMTIKAETSQGQMSGGKLVGGMTTIWTYRWVVGSSSPDAPTPITPAPTIPKPGKAAIAKIQNVKGAKAKVTVKTASGVTQYQIRYKVGKAKKWKTAKPSSGNTFTIKVKKGAKLSVQACMINSAGTGPWGKTKKFKTDKK